MFDGPFDVFALIIAIVAILIAIKASSQAAELRRRFNALEQMFYAEQRPVRQKGVEEREVQPAAPGEGGQPGQIILSPSERRQPQRPGSRE